jgi:heme exporter protein C
MINFFKQQWWKWLCAALLLYILLAGMLIPLGPGITSIQPFVFKTDSVYTFSIKGYNTNFSANNNTQVWFKAGQEYFCSVSSKVISTDEVQVSFGIPSAVASRISDNNYDVVLNNDDDGTISLREALTLLKGSAIEIDSTLEAKVTGCKVEVNRNQANVFAFPFREILYESIRNTFYHVPMWFAMLMMVILSSVFSVMHLKSGNVVHDTIASAFVIVALFFGAMGLFTGMMWATFTWGDPWPNDPKLNGAAVGVMIYVAYIILRGSITDEIKRGRVSAVYNIFAVVIFILFIFIIPRLPDTDSLHPGQSGNPAFSKYDLDSILRMVFYPAVIAWILLGLWFTSIIVRIKNIEIKNL